MENGTSAETEVASGRVLPTKEEREAENRKARERAEARKSSTRSRRSKAEPRPPEKDKTPADNLVALASLHETVKLAVSTVAIFAPERLRPTTVEVDSIFLPAEKILLRHATIPEVGEDFRDGMLCCIAIGQYALRVYQNEVVYQKQVKSGVRPQHVDYTDKGPRVAAPINIPTPNQNPIPEPVQNGETRFARPGESIGIPPQREDESPEDFMARLWQETYREGEDPVIPRAEA